MSLHKAKIMVSGLIALGIAGATPSQAQQTLYAIGNGGTTLVRFQSNNPSNVTVIGNFGGGAGFLDAIDFRPATGQLYGYLSSARSLFTVDLNSAQLTNVSPAGQPATNTFNLGLGFNPVIDRARIVTDSGQNIVYNPSTGVGAVFTDLNYPITDVNANASPSVIANAYTNKFAGAATTQQYGIDYGTNTLVTIANNAGTLGTIGSLGLDVNEFSGFSIFSSAPGQDTAYGLFTVGGTAGLYNVNLASGAATSIGAIGFQGLYSLAAVPGSSVVPEPGTWALAREWLPSAPRFCDADAIAKSKRSFVQEAGYFGYPASFASVWLCFEGFRL